MFKSFFNQLPIVGTYIYIYIIYDIPIQQYVSGIPIYIIYI